MAIEVLLGVREIDPEPRDVQDSTPLHLAATYAHEGEQIFCTNSTRKLI